MKIKFIDYIKRLFADSSGYAFKYKNIHIVASLSDVPNDTEDDIYIVQSGKTRKWVVFRCPNNCGHRVEVNLMKVRYPFWRLTLDRKKVSLYPSVVVNDCDAHFWLRNNGVLWATFDHEDFY